MYKLLSTTLFLAFSSIVSFGAVVFLDDFEAGTNIFSSNQTTGGYTNTNDVTAAQSDQNTSGGYNQNIWIKASNGFGSNRQGLVDEAHGDFTDPVGEQAYAFRYTNSGFTTVAGLLANATMGDQYTITFDVVVDGHNGGNVYNTGLVTFASGGSRNSIHGLGDGATKILASTSGTYTGTTYQSVSFSYTIGDNDDSAVIGQDVALRFDGSTNAAIIDNVKVDYVAIPEPSVTLLGALGALFLLKRKRS